MRLEVEPFGDALGDGGLLSAIASRAGRTGPALSSAADAFRDRAARVFATAGFGAWAPLAVGTARRKGHGRVLIDDGGLLRSLTVRGDRYHVQRVTADELFVGTRNPVAHLHRDGARGRPKRNPVPPVTAAESEHFAEHLLGYLVDGQT